MTEYIELLKIGHWEPPPSSGISHASPNSNIGKQLILLLRSQCWALEFCQAADKESSINTLWQEEDFKQICSRESLMEKAAGIEKTIVLKEHERARYNFDPTMFHENLF